MMPRLQAEEAFALAERVAIGTGSVEPGTSRDITRRWRDAIDGGTRRAAPAVTPTPQALGLLGIGVRRVPRKASTS